MQLKIHSHSAADTHFRGHADSHRGNAMVLTASKWERIRILRHYRWLRQDGVSTTMARMVIFDLLYTAMWTKPEFVPYTDPRQAVSTAPVTRYELSYP